jgi:hypothetical protein
VIDALVDVNPALNARLHESDVRAWFDYQVWPAG